MRTINDQRYAATFRTWMSHHDLVASEVGSLFGVGEATVQRWKVLGPPAHARLLCHLLDTPAIMDQAKTFMHFAPSAWGWVKGKKRQ